MDEGICQSEEDRSAGDNGDDGLSQRGKGIAVDSSTFSGDDEDGGNDGEVSGDESDDSNNGGNTGAERGTYGVGRSQRGGAAISWDLNYYAI